MPLEYSFVFLPGLTPGDFSPFSQYQAYPQRMTICLHWGLSEGSLAASGSPLRRIWRMAELWQVRNEPTVPWHDYAKGQPAFGCVSSVLYFQNSHCFIATHSTEECNPVAGYKPVAQPIPEHRDWEGTKAFLENSPSGHRPPLGPGLRLGDHLLSHLLPLGTGCSCLCFQQGTRKRGEVVISPCVYVMVEVR